MAAKPMMFSGKESKREERMEKKVSTSAYKRGERKEGEKPGKKRKGC